MRFYSKKKRSPAVIILPLLDILAILLIFFIVTTTFKKNLPQLQIRLPDSKNAVMQPAEQKEPLVLRVLDEENITLDDQPVRLEELGARLSSSLEEDPERQVAMQADRSAEFGLIVQILDIFKDTGIKNLPAFTQPAPSSDETQ